MTSLINPARFSEIMIKKDWDLTPLYTSDHDPAMEKDRKEVDKSVNTFVAKWKPAIEKIKDPKILRTALDEYELLMRRHGIDGKEGFYFWLKTYQNQNDTNLKARYNKITDKGKENAIKMEFFTLALSTVDKATQRTLLAAKELTPYHHLLEQLFRIGAHKLTEEGEKIMTLKSQTSYENWVKLVSSSLAKEEREITIEGKKQKKNFSELMGELISTDKKVRDQAAHALNAILLTKKEIAEAELNSVLGHKKVNDELRKHARPDEGRHVDDDMDTDVVDTLLKTVEKRFHLAQDFYTLKAKLFGVKKLAYHERNVPYENTAKPQPYTFEDSCALVEKVFRSLDPEFEAIFKRFLANGQVDVFPKKGKQSGAFCVWWTPEMPTYVLLNHTNKLNDVLTIAHEFGHAINAELSKKAQNALNFSTPTSTTEVASTFMEDFVLEELMKKANDETKLSLLMTKLNDDVSTIFRQVACYRFEQSLHEEFRKKGYLSAEEIGKIFLHHMKQYMGPAVEQSPGSENWWIYWDHIRRYFYVYSYASGLLISKALQEETAKDPHFIKKVKEFLAAGSSQSPKQIFARLGINIADEKFWNEGLDKVEHLLKEANALAKKLKKI